MTKDIPGAVDAAAEAVADVQEAVAEAQEEARDEIADAAERAETMGQFDALNARLAGIESRLEAGDVPPAVQSQLDEIRASIDAIGTRVGGATEEATDEALGEIDAAESELADNVEEATDTVEAAPERVESTLESVEEATEVEQVPERSHVLFRRLGKG